MFYCVVQRKVIFSFLYDRLYVCFFGRSPNGDIKVILDSDKTSVIFRGPHKTGTQMAKTFQASHKKI